MKKTLIIILAASLIFSMATLTSAANKAPAKIASILLMQLATFEQNISAGGDITIYVMGAPIVAKELKKNIGKKIGKSKVKAVTEGTDLPAKAPTILFVGDASLVDLVTGYTSKKKVLSVTNLPDLVNKGVNLGIGLDGNGKPKVFLNLTTTRKEDSEWNPAILKVAKTVK